MDSSRNTCHNRPLYLCLSVVISVLRASESSSTSSLVLCSVHDIFSISLQIHISKTQILLIFYFHSLVESMFHCHITRYSTVHINTFTTNFSVAARGCLPPGANVCVAAPASQISSAIRVFFQDFGHRECEPTFGVPSSSLPSHSPSLSSPSPILHPFPSPPLKVGPLNPDRKSGERCNLPRGSGEEPQPKLNLVHFSLKI